MRLGEREDETSDDVKEAGTDNREVWKEDEWEELDEPGQDKGDWEKKENLENTAEREGEDTRQNGFSKATYTNYRRKIARQRRLADWKQSTSNETEQGQPESIDQRKVTGVVMKSVGRDTRLDLIHCKNKNKSRALTFYIAFLSHLYMGSRIQLMG